MSTIIGIDLGTSTTEAAVVQDGKPVMLLNFEKEVVTPSAVGIDDTGSFVIGRKAKSQYLLSPERTAIEIKRKTGTLEKISLGKNQYTSLELSAKLLEYVRTYASECLEEEITRAVISVPAYFDEIQRRETMEAGTLAGFQVERILNEPTAAALSYGLEHMEEESHILVYDLGGGTFDVTLLEMFDGVLEVKASSGDNKLGGKDFDEKIIGYLLECFRKKHGMDLRKDTYAMAKLKEEAEKCKITLSKEKSCQVLIPMIAEKKGEPLALDEVVSAEQFEEMVSDLLERTHAPMDTVLSDAGVMPDEIDKVILVGGSTRMPVVVKDVEMYLGQTPESAVNPDYAVAEGAAIQAGIIEGSIRREDSIVMTDVNPYTLGVRCADGFSTDRMGVVIPRNVTIPTTRSERYYTNFDYQDVALIEVYQGESEIASSNHFLGEFEVHGIPRARVGEEEISVEFSYNLNGMLDVRATIVSTGKEASIQINMLEEHESVEEESDISKWKESPYAKRFRAVIRHAERALETARENEDSFLVMDLEDGLHVLKLALVQEDIKAAEDAETDLMDLLDSI